jgi:phosphoribosylamine---glycine ligase
MKKDLLIIGSGGREHVLGWALSKSAQAGKLLFAPGNAGTARLPQAENVAVGAEDSNALVKLALERRPDLVVIGPEVPLAQGLADQLREAGLVVFGPGAVGAQLEASKSWAKNFMQRHNIPTAAQATFETTEPALAYLEQQPGPFVIKADGLAAGKGVLVTPDRAEASHFIQEALSGQLFGTSGSRILIEEFMSGVEVSVLALCDTVSQTIIPLEPACDYKRAYDGDAGPNTGGMGVYSPPGFMTPDLRQQIDTQVLQPTLAGLVAEEIDYRGIAYAGLMITAEGPKVIEFNCRFGDPETQVLLPRLQSDLLELLELTAKGQLSAAPALQWLSGASVGIVLAAEGYPGPYTKGQPVHDCDAFDQAEDLFLFHAGTTLNSAGQVVTNGGRVFNLVALGSDIGVARQRVYNTLGTTSFGFANMRYRTDIAAREIS